MYSGISVLLLLLVGHALVVQAKDYYMDNTRDCGFVGYQTVGRDEVVKVYAKTTDTSSSNQGGCTIGFQASEIDGKLKLDFESFLIHDCPVKLQLSGGSLAEYTCGSNPPSYYALGRTMSITLYKPSPTYQNYNFIFVIRQTVNDRYAANSDSNPAAVGLVAGIAGGVFGVIFLAGCIAICCFRKYRAGRLQRRSPFVPSGQKSRLDDTSNSVSVGYTNESMKGSPMAKKKLLSHSDSSHSDERFETNKQRPNTLNLRGQGNNQRSGLNRKGPVNGVQANTSPVSPPAPPAPPPPTFNLRPTGGSQSDGSMSSNERGIDVKPTTPNGNMLDALRNNKKFRNSFKSNEKDAESRAKRISSSSSFDKFGAAPSPPSSDGGSSRPPLPTVPKSPKSKKSKHAMINRQPRPTSLSSEEIQHIERGLPEDGQDTNIKVLRDNELSSSGSEVVPIKVREEKRKPNTTHSLRPDRKGKSKNAKKPTQSVSSAIDRELDVKASPKPSPREGRGRIQSADSELDNRPRNQRDRFLDRDLGDSSFEKNGSGRYSKGKGRKSPRPGKASGRGFSHRRGRSMDQLDSRPSTPTSAYGSMEDLESLPPLQRASSKNSLYASRSSLYDRRRRRKGSYSESVVSYRDDMSLRGHTRGYDSYSDEDDFDGYERPLTRRDRDRMYRSENDLGRRVKEISTQTLRETATQTGAGVAVIAENKRLVKKKRRSKSTSSFGTQTVKKEAKAKSRSTEKLDEQGALSDKEKSKKRKTKRSKSANALDALDTDTEKPKPRPKPRPRKSTSADTHLDEKPLAGSRENLAADPAAAVYYPQSEGFQPQPGMFPTPQGYPMMPPAYPGQPAYPQYVMNGAPAPGYQGYPMPAAPQQMPPQMVPPPTGSQPAGVQPAGGRPRTRSNWEMLCEMTDGQAQRPADDVAETGSVASSVFTNYANPGGYPYYNNQQFPQGYPGPASQPLPRQPVLSKHQSIPDYENNDYRLGAAMEGKGHSSWDQLNAMTGNSAPPPSKVPKNTRNESVV